MMPVNPATRRDFVKVGVATLAGVTASAVTTAIAAEERRQSGTRKTIETDVLVCGGGCAGTVTAMAMGQASGVAAALAVQQNIGPQGLNGIFVRETLAANGAGPFTVA